ncbi:MAG: 2-amino-4-hydroxy-6-hydroxymethyldihydropteridine diphosphokinase [Flavobacteriales bacterium]
MTRQAYLLLGSNQGDSSEMLRKAIQQIHEHLGPVLKASSVYKTAPWKMESDQWFLNQVLCVEINKSATQVLETTLTVEASLGRIRNESNTYQSRNIDIDILYIDNEIVNSEVLTLPHPRLHERRFTLEPLSEIASDFVHPLLHNTNAQLLKNCRDQNEVYKL